MGSQVETWIQNCPNWVQWTFSAYWKPSHRKSTILQCEGCSTWTSSGILEHRYPIWQNWKRYQLPCQSTYHKSHWLTDDISYTYNIVNIFTHLNYSILYMITLINTSSARENGELVLFQLVLKVYPTHHSLAHCCTHLLGTPGNITGNLSIGRWVKHVSCYRFESTTFCINSFTSYTISGTNQYWWHIYFLQTNYLTSY